MALPLVALCALALLQMVGVARDALLASDLARLGVRVAATDADNTAVVDAITAAAGPHVTTDVRVLPSPRRSGDEVVVVVHLRRPGRWVDVELTGRAVAHAEPVLDAGGGP